PPPRAHPDRPADRRVLPQADGPARSAATPARRRGGWQDDRAPCWGEPHQAGRPPAGDAADTDADTRAAGRPEEGRGTGARQDSGWGETPGDRDPVPEAVLSASRSRRDGSGGDRPRTAAIPCIMARWTGSGTAGSAARG